MKSNNLMSFICFVLSTQHTLNHIASLKFSESQLVAIYSAQYDGHVWINGNLSCQWGLTITKPLFTFMVGYGGLDSARPVALTLLPLFLYSFSRTWNRIIDPRSTDSQCQSNQALIFLKVKILLSSFCCRAWFCC